MNLHDRAQRLWRTAQTPVAKKDVIDCLREREQRCIGLMKIYRRDTVTRRWLELGARVALNTRFDVEREGTYPITEFKSG